MNDEEWKTFCDGMNRLGKIAKEEYGIALTFHHHMGTVVQNADEVERMMVNTDPEYVSLLFDTGHFAYCGEDPLEMVKKYADRIWQADARSLPPGKVLSLSLLYKKNLPEEPHTKYPLDAFPSLCRSHLRSGS